MDDFLKVIQLLIYPALAFGGWILHVVWGAVKQLQEDMSNLRENVGKNYVPRDELRNMFDRILDEITMLRKDINTKADK